MRGYRDLVKAGVLQGGRDFPRIKEFFAWGAQAATEPASAPGGALRGGGSGSDAAVPHPGLTGLVGFQPDNTMCGGAPRSKICSFSPQAAVVLATVATLSSDPVRVRLQWVEVEATCFDPVQGGFKAGVVTSMARGTSPSLPITMGVVCPAGTDAASNTDRVIVLTPKAQRR